MIKVLHQATQVHDLRMMILLRKKSVHRKFWGFPFGFSIHLGYWTKSVVKEHPIVVPAVVPVAAAPKMYSE